MRWRRDFGIEGQRTPGCAPSGQYKRLVVEGWAFDVAFFEASLGVDWCCWEVQCQCAVFVGRFSGGMVNE